MMKNSPKYLDMNPTEFLEFAFSNYRNLCNMNNVQEVAWPSFSEFSEKVKESYGYKAPVTIKDGKTEKVVLDVVFYKYWTAKLIEELACALYCSVYDSLKGNDFGGNSPNKKADSQGKKVYNEFLKLFS